MSRYSVVREAIEPFRGPDLNWGQVQQVAGALLVRDCLIGTGSLTGGRRTRTPFGSIFLLVWGSFFGGAATVAFGGDYGFDPRNIPPGDLWILLFPLFGGMAVLAGLYGLLARLVGVVLGSLMWWQGRRASALYTLTPRHSSTTDGEDVTQAREAVLGALFAHSRIVEPVAPAPRPTLSRGLLGETTSWPAQSMQPAARTETQPPVITTNPVAASPVSAPPGWYPAGEPDMVRYWDGAAWTAHRHPAPGSLGALVPSVDAVRDDAPKPAP